MKNPYPDEKFTSAVDTMASSPKTIQERVGDAYLFNLIHVKTEEVPEEIQAKFDEVKKKLTRVEVGGGEGNVAATTTQMSTDEAIEIANEILHMAHVVKCDYYDI